MLHTQAVEKGTMDIINKLMADDKIASFNLVGGTALALKIGQVFYRYRPVYNYRLQLPGNLQPPD